MKNQEQKPEETESSKTNIQKEGKAKKPFYFLDEVVEVVEKLNKLRGLFWTLFLVCGSIPLIGHYFSIGYLPEVNTLGSLFAILIVLALTSIRFAIFLILFLSLPGIIWGIFLRDPKIVKYSDEERKEVSRRFDFWMLPIVWILVFLSFLFSYGYVIALSSSKQLKQVTASGVTSSYAESNPCNRNTTFISPEQNTENNIWGGLLFLTCAMFGCLIAFVFTWTFFYDSPNPAIYHSTMLLMSILAGLITISFIILSLVPQGDNSSWVDVWTIASYIILAGIINAAIGYIIQRGLHFQNTLYAFLCGLALFSFLMLSSPNQIARNLISSFNLVSANCKTNEVVVNQEGIKILKGLNIFSNACNLNKKNTPDDSGQSVEIASCRLEILSRLGTEIYFQSEIKRFTLPKSSVISISTIQDMAPQSITDNIRFRE
ncbi:MAG: hypothetical protein ACRCYY_13590 [Trueperaceae bacterium]